LNQLAEHGGFMLICVPSSRT